MKCSTFRFAMIAISASFVAFHAVADEDGPTLRIKTQSGDLVVGEPYRIVRRGTDGNYARMQNGDIPANGVIRLEGEWLQGDVKRVTVRVGSPSVDAGRIEYNPAKDNQDFEIAVPPNAGDTAPDLRFTSLFEGEAGKLSDFRGKFVLLDFWASWCGPCQEPMAHNQALLEKHADDWADRVRIVALSIDDDAETAQKHVEEKGWTAMFHAFSSEGEPGWASDAPKIYGVWSIPTVLLIDPAGEIIWRGNPNSADIEAIIENALEKAG